VSVPSPNSTLSPMRVSYLANADVILAEQIESEDCSAAKDSSVWNFVAFIPGLNLEQVGLLASLELHVAVGLTEVGASRLALVEEDGAFASVRQCNENGRCSLAFARHAERTLPHWLPLVLGAGDDAAGTGRSTATLLLDWLCNSGALVALEAGYCANAVGAALAGIEDVRHPAGLVGHRNGDVTRFGVVVILVDLLHLGFLAVDENDASAT